MTAAEAVTLIFRYLKANLPASVTTNIFKFERPLNFTNECIVINALPLSAEQFQEGIINVNYHVPNLRNATLNPVDESQPNSARLEAGAKIIDALLADYSEQDYHFEVLQSIPISNDDRKEWYMNFRVLFKNINL